MDNIEIKEVKPEEISDLSKLATSIVREHFDPLIGKEQNDYMLEKFQSVSAIKSQFEHGYNYFWVKSSNQNIGFLGFYKKDDKLCLSKFYLIKEQRGKKISKKMMEFIVNYCKDNQLKSIFLNVNRNNIVPIKVYEHLGFKKIREEKNDIGSGFYMDDFVFEYNI